MKINRTQLHKLYNEEIDRTTEECVDLVASVLEKNPSLVCYPEPQPAGDGCSGKPFNPKQHKLAYMCDDYIHENCEYYILGIIAENGKFKDFYYDSGLEYEEFSKLIPNGFAEAAESLYEFCPKRHPNKKAKDILAKHGYTEITETQE